MCKVKLREISIMPFFFFFFPSFSAFSRFLLLIFSRRPENSILPFFKKKRTPSYLSLKKRELHLNFSGKNRELLRPSPVGLHRPPPPTSSSDAIPTSSLCRRSSPATVRPPAPPLPPTSRPGGLCSCPTTARGRPSLLHSEACVDEPLASALSRAHPPCLMAFSL
jgi:hypothetical protein